MDVRVDEYLRESVLNKCKLILACRFQGDDTIALNLTNYELAYIVEKMKGLKDG